MALILLVIIGVIVSWCATVVARVEEGKAMRRMALVGLAASIAVGLIANGGVFLGSISWTAMGAAVVGSAAGLAGYRYYLTKA